MNERAQVILGNLLEGNRRVRAGLPTTYCYSPKDLLHISRDQMPKAAIVACADSLVSPELVFDQPIGSIFASRVPAYVASDSSKWMLDIAVSEFHVPFVMVIGHTGCLAIGQLLEGNQGGACGLHRFSVLSEVYRATAMNPLTCT